MKISEQDIKRFLEVEAQCLRCGSCCHNYDVMGVPGYGKDNGLVGHKPGGHACKHREPAYLDEQSQWHLATCRIHESSDYPKECLAFKMPSLGPFGGACALGLAIWKMHKERNPESKLPEEVQKALEEFAQMQKLFKG